ncbi:SprT-like protease [Mycobacterium phage Validus]|uniref:SprT-like protease n=1 Tax=Mycobacterium phage Validus TaxID=1414747 RepID=V5URQ6_9CAUD|nr:SprT-like protease [Mycobacterium phage Validus]AHB79612.1 SprT-like protease [Mycobacterium phage Validus]
MTRRAAAQQMAFDGLGEQLTFSPAPAPIARPAVRPAVAAKPAHMSMAEARRIATDLIAEHGLTGWTVTFDNARRRAGVCKYGTRTIGLSKPLMAQRSWDDTWMTITHEVAHALVGHSHGHDAVWAAKHRSLGGNGKRCFEHLDETAPWMGTCSHGKKFARYRAPKRLDGWRCKCPAGSSPVVWEHRR